MSQQNVMSQFFNPQCGRARPAPILFLDLNQTLQHTKISARERETICSSPRSSLPLSRWGNVVGVTKFVDVTGECFSCPVARGLFALSRYLPRHRPNQRTVRAEPRPGRGVGGVLYELPHTVSHVGWSHFSGCSEMGSEGRTFECLYDVMKPNVGGVRSPTSSLRVVDVRAFHFWKNVTKGRHLWLRNIASTTASQVIDTIDSILCDSVYAMRRIG